MKKCKEFIVARDGYTGHLFLKFTNGLFCKTQRFWSIFGIALVPGQKKRVRITVEEVK